MGPGYGECVHGKFKLIDGCQECLRERVNQKLDNEERLGIKIDSSDKNKIENCVSGPFIVKVVYLTDIPGAYHDGKEYTYYSVDRLEVGDIVIVPMRSTTRKAKVAAVDVPDSEIEAFRDKVKTIPSGSKMVEQEEAERGLVRDVHTGELIPDMDSAVQLLVEKAKRFLEFAGGRVVNSPTSEKSASEDLILIRNAKKAIEAKRKEYLDPGNAESAQIRDFFKQLQDPIEEADRLTAGAILGYGKEVTRQREEAERIEADALQLAKDQEIQTGEHTVSLEEVPKPAPEKARVRTDIGMASKVAHWKWREINRKLIPPEYMIPNEVILNAIAKQSQDKQQIPGIEFYNKPHLSTRSR